MKRERAGRSDLTPQEQAHARIALRFLRARCGGWEPLSKILRGNKVTIRKAASGGVISASLAVRIARFVKVGVDDLLAGKYPPAGACPHCGHVASAEDPELITGGASIEEGGDASKNAR